MAHMRFAKWLAVVIAASFMGPVALAEEGAIPAETISQPTDSGVLLAQSKRKKKKKKRKKDSSAEDTGGSSGGAIHKAQEGGKDEPYKWEVGLLSDFKIVNTKVGDATNGAGVYNLSAKMLYILMQSLEVGGQLDFDEMTAKAGDTSSTDRTYVLTLLGAYNFGNIDTDEMVFFVNFGFGFGSSTNTTKSDAGDTDASASITRLTFGLGLHYFVDSNVALTTQFVYDSDSKKVKDVDDPVTTSTIHIAKIGFSLFI